MGEFENASVPLTMAATTRFVRDEVKKRFGGEAFAVLAISLGGMVAMQWMRDFEADLEAAVLINSSAKDSAFYHRLRYQIWPEMATLIGNPNPREREKQIIDLVMNSETAKEQAITCWARIAQEHPIRVGVFARQIFAASQFRSLEMKPHIPVLLLSSLGDRFVDPSCSERLHQKYQWKLERHAWAGHDLPWDDPQWVTDHIKRFFA